MTLLPVLLPQDYKVKVDVGEKITAGQILAEKTISSKNEVIHLAGDLGISPKNALGSLKKGLGSKITTGDDSSKKREAWNRKETIS